MKLQERAQKYEYKLNENDDQIIDYMIKHKNRIIQISIQRLAEELYTVPNTITRLSKKLGYDGFSQLKNNLKEEVKGEARLEETPIQYNIKQTLNLIDYELLDKVAGILRKSRRIFIFGVGDTLPFCEILSTHLKVGGLSAEYFLHRHDAVHAINHASNQDILILISMSGETQQILEMVKHAKQKNVCIISLTHFIRNSLATEADYKLYFHSPKKKLENYNVSDKTPVMLLIQILSDILWK